MKNSIILILPTGAATVSNSKDIARHFNLNQISDGNSFKHWRDVPAKDTLILATVLTRELRISGIKVIYAGQIADEIVLSR